MEVAGYGPQGPCKLREVDQLGRLSAAFFFDLTKRHSRSCKTSFLFEWCFNVQTASNFPKSLNP